MVGACPCDWIQIHSVETRSDRCCFGLPPAKFKNEWNSAVGRPPLGGVQEEAGDLTDSVPLGDEAEPAVHTSGGRGCSVPLGNVAQPAVHISG